MQRFDPFSTITGVAADMGRMWDIMSQPQIEANQKELEKIPLMLGLSIGQNLTNKTYMQGLSDGIEALKEPERSLPKFLSQVTASMVPNIAAQYARYDDPYLRDARSLVELIKARIPGMSETLPARVNIWGDDIRRETPASFINPVYMSTEKKDRTTEELKRIQFFPGMVDRKIMGVDLDPQQYRAYAQMAGKNSKMALDRYVNSEAWQHIPDYQKAEIADKIIRRSREISRRNMLSLYPDLYDAIINKKMEARQ
jgi:hypothetical protein